MGKRKTLRAGANANAKPETTMRQIIQQHSHSADWSARQASIEECDIQGFADPEYFRKHQPLAGYKKALTLGWNGAHEIVSSLCLRPDRRPGSRGLGQFNVPAVTAVSVIGDDIMRPYREDEEVWCSPHQVVTDIGILNGVLGILQAYSDSLRPTDKPKSLALPADVPFVDWPSDKAVTLGRAVGRSWAQAIQQFIVQVFELTVPRINLLDHPPSIEWLNGAARNIRLAIPHPEEWVSANLHPPRAVTIALEVECDRWEATRRRATQEGEWSLPMSREELARRYWGDENARFRKLQWIGALMRRIQPVPGRPRLVQFDLRGQPPEVRERLTVARWP